MKVPADLLKAHIENVAQRLERFHDILNHSCDGFTPTPIPEITLRCRLYKTHGVSGEYAAYTEDGVEHSFYLSNGSTQFNHDYEDKVISPDEPAYDVHIRQLLSIVTQIAEVIKAIHPETTFNSFDFNAGYQHQSFTWLFSCGFLTELYGYSFEYAIDKQQTELPNE